MDLGAALLQYLTRTGTNNQNQKFTSTPGESKHLSYKTTQFCSFQAVHFVLLTVKTYRGLTLPQSHLIHLALFQASHVQLGGRGCKDYPKSKILHGPDFIQVNQNLKPHALTAQEVITLCTFFSPNATPYSSSRFLVHCRRCQVLKDLISQASPL